jgi:pseudouridine-5'-phosphate glycosidase
VDVLKFSNEVKNAKLRNLPIVALESTIITHGMPYPENLNTAMLVEKAVRENGAIPATIAVIEGVINVGMSDEQLEFISTNSNTSKLSRADLAVCLSNKKTGSTTVAATMIVAKLGGIEVFATGGIGGAHQGSELNFDISSDLYELSKTPVNVVCSGPKAILDIPKTLETLETLGVPVITYKQDNLPAFWSSSSELKSPLRMDDITQIAQAFILRKNLGIDGGQLIANPIPIEKEIPNNEISTFIKKALKAAIKLEIEGKALTPFLLKKVSELTKGRSLEANVELIINNASLAAKIAKSLKELN